MKKEKYIINPSELTYICHHCAHIKHNYKLEDRGISAGITGELDTLEKNFFLGDVKKLDQRIPKGKIIDADHKNESFVSKILFDNKKRPFRIRGKGDALIEFNDKTHGIIDYKTSKFKDKKGKNYNKELLKKINEYNRQLHCYDILYSHLETHTEYLEKIDKGVAMGWPEKTIKKRVAEKVEHIKKISINKTTLLGLVFVYPEKIIDDKLLNINFSFEYKNVEYNPVKFMEFLTAYIDKLEEKKPPPVPTECKNPKASQHCVMHSHFYDQKKLPKRIG
tara:strand:+ start:49 stop:882 length:834 start_codon:yes stop_codon:yes gene_type:complete